MQSVAEANNLLAFDLLAQLRSEKSDEENLLLSPLSISVALAMTSAGAGGTTAEEMVRTLHLDALGEEAHAGYGQWLADLNEHRDGYELNVVNRLFGQQGYAFEQEYLDLISDQYRGRLETLDFRTAPEPARQHINHWVEEQTNDRIRDLLPQGSIDTHSRLVLANALYFNGKWKHQFDTAATRPGTFQRTDGQEIEVPMMRQTDRFGYGQFDGYEMLEMRYEGDDLSMVLVLPESHDGLDELESTLTAESFQSSVDALTDQEVVVELPKFSFRDQAMLSRSLQALGMTTAFTERADFSGIADDRLAIDDVFHKTFIDVSEHGTEAAAATAVVVGITSVPTPTAEFRADHPFLFAIRDRHTGGLLFLGRVAVPEVDEEFLSSLSVAEPATLPVAAGLVLVGGLLARLRIGRRAG